MTPVDDLLPFDCFEACLGSWDCILGRSDFCELLGGRWGDWPSNSDRHYLSHV